MRFISYIYFNFFAGNKLGRKYVVNGEAHDKIFQRNCAKAVAGNSKFEQYKFHDNMG